MENLINNKKKYEILVEHILSMDYGETITHTEISGIIQEEHDSNKYRAIVNKAKKILLKEGKAIESIKDVGYRVIDPDCYTNKSVKQFKQGFHRLQNGYDTLQYAPTDKMSNEGRKVHRDVSDRAKILYAAMAGGCTELTMLSKKNSPLLPENVGRR